MASRRAVSVLVCAVLVVLIGPSAVAVAQEQQHQNANIYANWAFDGPTGYWNVDQRIQVTEKAPASYWALLWGFTAGSDAQGGYLGVQTDGTRFDGSRGDTSIFSLWNATGARGKACGSFDGEGSGRSCRLPFTIDPQTDYRLRVWRLNADDQGQWWGAWIQNQKTGEDVEIGALRVEAAKTSMTGIRNFSEYFGPAVGCGDVPRSVAYFTAPAANQVSPGLYQVTSRAEDASRAACTGGGAEISDTGWTEAVKVTLGGPIR